MTKVALIILAILISPGQVAVAEKTVFFYSHTKGARCAENWQVMEDLLNSNGLRCKEVVAVDGFPYLRGTPAILKLAQRISTKYAGHKWLELLRRIDLEARYAELSALPEKDLEKFCSKAQIQCYQGRIRAYVAHCSAIIMGDEKTNHDFMKVLKKRAEEAANKKGGQARCFDDNLTLDGIAGDDVLSGIFSQPPSRGLSSSRLQKRIMLQRTVKPY